MLFKLLVDLCQGHTAVVCVDSVRWRLPPRSTTSSSADSSSAPCTSLTQHRWVGSWPASPGTWMRVRLDLSWLWNISPGDPHQCRQPGPSMSRQGALTLYSFTSTRPLCCVGSVCEHFCFLPTSCPSHLWLWNSHFSHYSYGHSVLMCSRLLFTVDVRLTMQAEMLLQNLTLVMFCLGMVGIVFPWFLISILPLGAFLCIVNRISRSDFHHLCCVWTFSHHEYSSPQLSSLQFNSIQCDSSNRKKLP